MEKSGQVKTVVLEPFIKLVRLVARVFYDSYTTESDSQHKSGRGCSRGTAVVVLDALTRRQWVREEDLAKDLNSQAKQLRKIMRYFEEQKLIMRYHRKETARRTNMGNVGVEKAKVHTHSYCCLDYSQIYDIARYKLHRMKKKLKDELEDRYTVQEYSCPNCRRKYNALDALRLISMEDECFHCEHCNGELVVECNKLNSEDVVVGGDNARKQQQDKLKLWLQYLEVRLEPLMVQINRVKDLPFPGFESFPAWEARAIKAARENGGLDPNDPLRSQAGYGSTPMPFLGETKVEVNLGEGKEDVKANGGDSSQKVLPPWMIKEGMKLTEQQRGETRQEPKVEGGGGSEVSDDKKSVIGNGDDKDLMDEYIKACYAALLQRQELAIKPNQQQESTGEVTTDIQLDTTTSSDRQVGMKSKREEEDEEDVEWDEVAPPVVEYGSHKTDSNVEEEEEDDIDWEEG